MLFKLLTAPISLPVAGMKFVFQQVADLADAELYDESVVHEQLLLLQVQLEDDEVTEEEYQAREAELMLRLREIKARQRAAASAAEAADTDTEAETETETGDLPPEANVTARRCLVIETPFDAEA